MKTKLPAILFMCLGVCLILGAAALLTYNRGEENQAALASGLTTQAFLSALPDEPSQAPSADTAPVSGAEPTAGPVSVPDELAAANTAGAADKTTLINGNNYIGVISIPALNVTVPVLDSWSYPGLKIAACLYYGSVAGQDAVIAAHSYKTFFGQLSKLSYGDQVIFTDADGVRHDYTVAEKTITKPYDVAGMTQSGYPLTLFSCNYDGSARETIRCVLGD